MNVDLTHAGLFLLDLVLGLILGGLGGLFGIGGGVIAIPMLGFIYGMDQTVAQGTALVMILPNIVLGYIRYAQRNPIPLNKSVVLGLSSILTAWLSGRFAVGLNAAVLHTAFACFLFALVAFFIWQMRGNASAGSVAGQSVLPQKSLFLVGMTGGVMSGVFTVGGGIIGAPAMMVLYGMPQVIAQGLGLALVIPSTCVALLTYGMAGKVDWTTGIALAIGGLFSVSWGVALAHRLSARRLRQAFCLMLFLTACLMLIHH